MVIDWIVGDRPKVWSVADPGCFHIDSFVLNDGTRGIISRRDNCVFISSATDSEGKTVEPVNLKLPDRFYGSGVEHSYRPSTDVPGYLKMEF